MNNLMTTKQVADFCGVSVSTVLRWNSVNRRTGQKYRPDFPNPDIKSCPNKWASRKIYKFAGVIEECEAAQIEMTHPIAHSQT